MGVKSLNLYDEFTFGSMDYQVVGYGNRNGLDRVRVWCRVRGTSRWELGHSMLVPAGVGMGAALSYARSYLCGEMTWDVYNRLLIAPPVQRSPQTPPVITLFDLFRD